MWSADGEGRLSTRAKVGFESLRDARMGLWDIILEFSCEDISMDQKEAAQ